MTVCNVFSNCFSRMSVRLALTAAILVYGISYVGSSVGYGQVNAQLLEKSLARVPKQLDASFETVAAADVARCTGRYETRNSIQGILILSPNGQSLRWFADSNGDKKIDLYSYYKDGVESYREMDTDFDDKTDQFRWLGISGMRWGIDRDEDGKIDSWKMISAEEVTYEAFESFKNGDVDRFARLLLNADEVASIGLGPTKARELASRVESSELGFKSAIKTAKAFDKESRWVSFGADKPGVIPSGTDESTSDIIAYENTMAFVEIDTKPQQLLCGTLIKVGDAWRMVDTPRLATDGGSNTEQGMFFASTSVRSQQGTEVSAAMEKLLDDLSSLDKKLEAAANAGKPALHAQKADVLQRLVESSTTQEDAQAFTRQMADQVQAAAQSGEYPDGVARLKKFQGAIQSMLEAKSETPYVAYRVLTTEYNLALAGKDVNYELVQKKHLENLEAFVDAYPESSDAADAMIQLGLNSELANDLKSAKEWYERTKASFAKTPQGEKAGGAVLRLDLKGRQITFEGTTLNGKNFTTAKLNRPVIVHYWASWCEPCKADMQEFQKLMSKYGKQGLTIVGINADNDAAKATEFLKANRGVDWVQLHEKGGLESRLAAGLGVFSLPVTIVIDKSGTVQESTSHYAPNMELVIQGLLK